jgi:hypothetical protein
MTYIKQMVIVIATGLIVGVTLFLGPHACSSAGNAIIDAGNFLIDAGKTADDAFIPKTNAQSNGSGCSQWEISTYFPDDDCMRSAGGGLPSITKGNKCSIPDGWEPIGIAGFNTWAVLVRTCIK